MSLRSEDAQKKAKDLFFSLLTEEQKQEFHEYQRVTVVGGKTKNVYTINYGFSQNMYGTGVAATQGRTGSCRCPECSDPTRRRNICYHMQLDCPSWDHMAAQLLYIRYAEDKFLDGAYIS